MGVTQKTINGAKVIGDYRVRETRRSQSIEVGDSIRPTAELHGLFTDLRARLPAKGQAWAMMPGYKVESARLDRDGLLATLFLQLEPDTTAGVGVDEEDNPPIDDLWEVDWRPIEKPLLTCPTLTGGTDNPQIYIDVDAWRNEPSSVNRIAFKYQSGVDESGDPILVTLDGVAKKAAQKILQGIESWLAFSPVVIRRRRYRKPVSFGGAGFRQAPDFAPAGWQWLKTGDNLTGQADKSFLRIETWTGAEEWDSDLYPEGT